MGRTKTADRNGQSRQLLLGLLVMISLEALIAAVILLQHTSERAALLGYSAPRLMLLGALLLTSFAGSCFVFLLIRSEKDARLITGWVHDPARRQMIMICALLIGGLAWVLLCTPAYRLGGLAGYAEELLPISVFVALAAVETLLVLSLSRHPFSPAKIIQALRKDLGPLTLWGIIIGLLLVGWMLIASTRLGIESQGEDYWYEAGVPLLAGQVVLALIIGLIVHKLETRSAKLGSPLRLDLAIFLGIWCAAGLIWMLTPLPAGYFNPGPMPPTHETHPYSDAAETDIQSQNALIGEGIDHRSGLARPVYPVFLVIVHLLTGQDYQQNMNFQAMVFGVFPAIIYLIGSVLVNRSAGAAAAAAIVMRGVNAISATALLNLANPKLMLSDFPTAVGIAIALLLCVLWFTGPDNLRFPLLVGGAIALSVYLRPTAFGIVPPIFLLAYLALRKLPQKALYAGLALVIAGFVLSTTPWELRQAAVPGGNIYPSSLRKFFNVLKERYPAVPRSSPSGPDEAATPLPPSESERSHTQQDEKTGGEDWGDPLSESIRVVSRASIDPGVIANHFLHNIVTSVVVLPSSAVLDDLRTTVRAENSYWRSSWNAALTATQSIFLAVNLGFLALGIATAARRYLIAGLLPAAILLGYHFANAFGRTSGGRYIVPVDWIVVLYYVIGLLQAGRWLLQGLGLLKAVPMRTGAPRPAGDSFVANYRSVRWPALGLFLAGLLLLVPDFAFPQRFEKLSRTQLFEQLSAYDPPAISETQRQFINDLLDEQGRLYVGKIMFPRYAPGGATGEMFSLGTAETVQYPLLVFSLIGPEQLDHARFVAPLTGDLPNYSDAFVIGCRQRGNFEVAMLILTGPTPRVLTRDPLPYPDCPLPEPVCDANGICR